MAVNGSGIRDTARVLRISPTTVVEELKKRERMNGISTGSSILSVNVIPTRLSANI
jgi:transposase-like protein